MPAPPQGAGATLSLSLQVAPFKTKFVPVLFIAVLPITFEGQKTKIPSRALDWARLEATTLPAKTSIP